MTHKRFLVVDDDCDDTDLFVEAVDSIDASVSCLNAVNGLQALDKLKTHTIEKPDIIFLDINMPVMDGWQVLSNLKSTDNLKDIPVIMYSTSSKMSDMRTAMSSGALCFFTKPNSFKVLKQILRTVVDHMDGGRLDKMCDAIRSYKS